VLADRESLLDAAERVVREVGPDVTMEAIAAAATVTKPILYRTVGDKDAVVAALADRFVDRINEAGTVAVAGARDEREGLHRLIRSFIDQVDGDRNLFLFVTAGGSSATRIGQELRLADRSAAPMAAQFAAQRSRAGLDPAVADTWAYGIIGTLHFAILWWLRTESVTPAELADHLTELLWSGTGLPLR
jgi:AcrR family transcriptional regulator